MAPFKVPKVVLQNRTTTTKYAQQEEHKTQTFFRSRIFSSGSGPREWHFGPNVALMPEIGTRSSEDAVRSHVVWKQQLALRSQPPSPHLSSAQSAGASNQMLMSHFSQQLDSGRRLNAFSMERDFFFLAYFSECSYFPFSPAGHNTNSSAMQIRGGEMDVWFEPFGASNRVFSSR